MSRERIPDLDEILQQEAEAPIPEPQPDLPNLALARVRGWILMTDLVRWATLEPLWTALGRNGGDADRRQERQD